MPEDFKVKVGEFEGPLELLLDLIEKRKLHISTISLAQVADDFIEHIKAFEETDVDKKDAIANIADFILVASTLLLIKSKSLLPTLDLTSEEEENISDLENRLALYKKHKELSQNLQKMFGNFLYFACEKKEKLSVFAPSKDISIDNLKTAISEVIKNLPKKIEELPKIAVRKVISLEEMIGRLTDRIQKSLRSSFHDFANVGKAEKVEVIVSFLAMLELVKRGAVRVSQEEHFEDIVIESENTGVPFYS